jgi:hypothetical protein
MPGEYSMMMACEAQGGGEPPAIISRLVIFLEEGKLEAALATFLEENTEHGARREEETGEYSLECQDLYRKYVSLIEDGMKGFLEREDVTDQELKTICEQALRDDRTNATSRFLDAWISSWEFEAFIDLLEEFRLEQLQDWDGEAKGEAKEEEAGEGKQGSDDEAEAKWQHK